MKALNRLLELLGKYLTLFVIGATVAALIFPEFFIPIANAKLFSLSAVNVLLAVIMFGTGTSIKPGEIVKLAKKPGILAAGILVKYLFMGVGAYLVAKLLKLDGELAFGLLLLGCMPPGTACNVIVLLAGGDVAFSVAITVVATLLAPVLVPLFTYVLGGQWVSVNFLSMAMNILTVVLIPVLAGMIFRRISSERICQKTARILTPVSQISVLMIVAICTAPNRAVILSVEALVIVGAVFVNFAIAASGSILFAKITGMERKRFIALVIAAAEQNSGLSAGIASGYSKIYPAAPIPSVIAVSLNVVLSTVLGSILGKNQQENKEEWTEELEMEDPTL